ncbi:hypothetical protein HOY82DRAFT_41094 [Tuber indicum]|nr:hypothetical protein HOY82DRAFT_41094 [Tuber indicum]
MPSSQRLFLFFILKNSLFWLTRSISRLACFEGPVSHRLHYIRDFPSAYGWVPGYHTSIIPLLEKVWHFEVSRYDDYYVILCKHFRHRRA